MPVDGHVGGFACSELVGDDGKDVPVRGRGGAWFVDLDPVVAEAAAVMQTGASEEPTRDLRVDDSVRVVREAGLVPAHVLPADQARLGTAEVAPASAADHGVAGNLHPVEEVVGGEEGEIASLVAVARDQVVRVRGDVLLVPREDDQPVAAQGTCAYHV